MKISSRINCCNLIIGWRGEDRRRTESRRGEETSVWRACRLGSNLLAAFLLLPGWLLRVYVRAHTESISLYITGNTPAVD